MSLLKLQEPSTTLKFLTGSMLLLSGLYDAYSFGNSSVSVIGSRIVICLSVLSFVAFAGGLLISPIVFGMALGAPGPSTKIKLVWLLWVTLCVSGAYGSHQLQGHLCEGIHHKSFACKRS